MPRDIILHCHLFKNAGSTIDWSLKNNFGEKFIDHRDDHKMLSGSFEYLENYLEGKNVTAISSHHMPFYPERMIGGHWMIMLRDPIARVKSVYTFENNQPISSLGSRMAKKLSYKEYVEWRMRDDVPTTIKDFHVRYIKGISNPGRRPEELWLHDCIEKLSLNNVHFGLVEYFDESMIIFENRLNNMSHQIDMSYIKQNVNRWGGDIIDHDNTSRLIRENNRLDIDLYSWAKDILTKEFNAIDDKENKLVDFKHRCLVNESEHSRSC